jgi:hypothetical protein
VRINYLVALGAASLPGCGPIDKILYSPETRPDQWCGMRPCVEIGGIVLNEPLGSF